MCCPAQDPGLLHRNAKFRHATTVYFEIIFTVPDPSTILLIQCQKRLYFPNAKTDGLRMVLACILTTFPYFLLAGRVYRFFSHPPCVLLAYISGGHAMTNRTNGKLLLHLLLFNRSVSDPDPDWGSGSREDLNGLLDK